MGSFEADTEDGDARPGDVNVLKKRFVKMPKSGDELIRSMLADETLSEEIKGPILERQKAELRKRLERGCPGWQDEIHERVYVHEHKNPLGHVPVVQHGGIE